MFVDFTISEGEMTPEDLKSDYYYALMVNPKLEPVRRSAIWAMADRHGLATLFLLAKDMDLEIVDGFTLAKHLPTEAFMHHYINPRKRHALKNALLQLTESTQLPSVFAELDLIMPYGFEATFWVNGALGCALGIELTLDAYYS